MKVQPVSKIRSTQNDLYPRCTEKNSVSTKVLKECSTVVSLGMNNIPAFLYNKDGQIK